MSWLVVPTVSSLFDKLLGASSSTSAPSNPPPPASLKEVMDQERVSATDKLKHICSNEHFIQQFRETYAFNRSPLPEDFVLSNIDIPYDNCTCIFLLAEILLSNVSPSEVQGEIENISNQLCSVQEYKSSNPLILISCSKDQRGLSTHYYYLGDLQHFEFHYNRENYHYWFDLHHLLKYTQEIETETCKGFFQKFWLHFTPPQRHALAPLLPIEFLFKIWSELETPNKFQDLVHATAEQKNALILQLNASNFSTPNEFEQFFNALYRGERPEAAAWKSFLSHLSGEPKDRDISTCILKHFPKLSPELESLIASLNEECFCSIVASKSKQELAYTILQLASQEQKNRFISTYPLQEHRFQQNCEGVFFGLIYGNLPLKEHVIAILDDLFHQPAAMINKTLLFICSFPELKNLFLSIYSLDDPLPDSGMKSLPKRVLNILQPEENTRVEHTHYRSLYLQMRYSNATPSEIASKSEEIQEQGVYGTVIKCSHSTPEVRLPEIYFFNLPGCAQPQSLLHVLLSHWDETQDCPLSDKEKHLLFPLLNPDQFDRFTANPIFRNKPNLDHATKEQKNRFIAKELTIAAFNRMGFEEFDNCVKLLCTNACGTTTGEYPSYAAWKALIVSSDKNEKNNKKFALLFTYLPQEHLPPLLQHFSPQECENIFLESRQNPRFIEILAHASKEQKEYFIRSEHFDLKNFPDTIFAGLLEGERPDDSSWRGLLSTLVLENSRFVPPLASALIAGGRADLLKGATMEQKINIREALGEAITAEVALAMEMPSFAS